MKEIGDYYIGLDLGTSSVGWAVTDVNYNIVRAKGKDLWGIREFDPAEPAAARRTQRISRRRRQRETARIGLLKSYFADALKEKDRYFLERLDNSKYYLEDKSENVKYKNAIFNDADFTDSDYYHKYPTIFHLRKALIEDRPETHDVRLVYLALLNMFKHRGHFLDSTSYDDDGSKDMESLFDGLSESIENAGIADNADDKDLQSEFPECRDISALAEILSSRRYSRRDKKEKISELLGISSKQKIFTEIVKGICGLKTDTSVIFGKNAESNEEKRTDISFSDSNAEERYAELEEILSEEQFAVIESMRAIYDNAAWHSVIGDEKYLSFARVKDYEKHKEDLSLLKRLLKNNSPEDYDKMFRSDEPGSYSAYVNSCNTNKLNRDLRNGDHVRRGIKNRRQEDLYAFIKKMLKSYPDSEEKQYILSEIDKETFLPKQLTASNGVIPNQIHARELKKILDNAKKYLEFLNHEDESGLTTADRIYRLFIFTIPYYVGPLNEHSNVNGTGWVVRKRHGKVLPWNFEQMVDISATREKFIDRLINNCTYLNNEKVLPKASLMYESYCVLNEINNIRVCGEKLSVTDKQKLYTELFEQGKKVKRKDIEKFLVNQGITDKEGVESLTGIDIEINSSLASYGKFKSVFGDKIREDKYKSVSEEIIRLCTIYGDAKKELKDILRERYVCSANESDNILTDKDINKITGFKFKDWGRLSKEFLLLNGADKSTGEIRSLIRALWETNSNLMELLSERFTYSEELREKQNTALNSLYDIKYEDLNDMYFSAPVKRMVWQTLRILKELQSAIGHAPSKIFVEMARGPEDKKERKDSRAKTFAELYKAIKDDDNDWAKIIDDADKNGAIRSKKMYLYLTQMGKCMYTGHEIKLDELFTTKYDIDHIYPRHFVKDDNLNNNLVLVEKEKNNHKQDKYPIEESIRSSRYAFWHMLLDKKLITKEKFSRLTGSRPFTDDQLAGFIARQLVETRQGTKGIANLLQEIMPDSTETVFAKAGNVSDFRKNNGLLKSRIANDMHHAHDAYLNIVVGNAYDVKFTRDPYRFIKSEYKSDERKYHYHLTKMFDDNIERNGYTAWQKGDAGTINTVKRTLAKPSPLLTRMSFEGHGKIADQTLHDKYKAQKSPEAYIPLKENDDRLTDVTKYGGFSSAPTTYLTLAEYSKKGKKIRSIEAVPIYLAERIERSDGYLIKYLSEKTGASDIHVRYKKIKVQSLIKLNGFYVYLTGKTNNQLCLRNAVQLKFSQDEVNYIKKIENESIGELTSEKNMSLYELLINKHSTNIMKHRPNPILDKIITGTEIFKEADIEIQKKILTEILRTTSVGGNEVDLKAIGASVNTGKMTTNKNITGNNEFKLIQQSVTGIYEKEIDLLTI